MVRFSVFSSSFILGGAAVKIDNDDDRVLYSFHALVFRKCTRSCMEYYDPYVLLDRIINLTHPTYLASCIMYLDDLSTSFRSNTTHTHTYTPRVPMFRDFYTEVAGEYFDGEVSPVYDNSYGYAADAFIAKLIVTLANIPFVFNAATSWSPIRGELMTPPPNSAHVAKLILIKRQEVAHDWKVLLEQVPVDHTPIRQLLIANQYHQSSSSSSSIATLLPSEDTNNSNTNHNQNDDDPAEAFSIFQ